RRRRSRRERKSRSRATARGTGNRSDTRRSRSSRTAGVSRPAGRQMRPLPSPPHPRHRRRPPLAARPSRPRNQNEEHDEPGSLRTEISTVAGSQANRRRTAARRDARRGASRRRGLPRRHPEAAERPPGLLRHLADDERRGLRPRAARTSARRAPGPGVIEGHFIPYLPEALEQRKENFENRHTDDPTLKGFTPGVPRMIYYPAPFQIFQRERDLIIVQQFGHSART